MALPVLTPTPTPPERRDDYAGLEELDRPELDDFVAPPLEGDDSPDTERDPDLPVLDWDDDDGESGIKPRR